MKKLAFFAVCALAVVSCNDGVKQANLLAGQQRDSLNQIIAQKENELSDMMTTLSDIEEGFREITEAQSRVALAKQGEGTSSAQRIRENMQFIRNTMNQNKELINKLKQQVREGSFKSDQLKKIVENLTQQMEEKDRQLMALREELDKKDTVEYCLVCLRNEERAEGAEDSRRWRGAPFELQQGVLHEDRYPHRQGNQALQQVCSDADRPSLELIHPSA